MSEIERLPEVGSHLADLRLTRKADGVIAMDVISMDPALIETTGEEVHDRLGIISAWAAEGAREMAQRFGPSITPPLDSEAVERVRATISIANRPNRGCGDDARRERLGGQAVQRVRPVGRRPHRHEGEWAMKIYTIHKSNGGLMKSQYHVAAEDAEKAIGRVIAMNGGIPSDYRVFKEEPDYRCDFCGRLHSDAVCSNLFCAPPFIVRMHSFSGKHPADLATAMKGNGDA